MILVKEHTNLLLPLMQHQFREITHSSETIERKEPIQARLYVKGKTKRIELFIWN